MCEPIHQIVGKSDDAVPVRFANFGPDTQEAVGQVKIVAEYAGVFLRARTP